MTTTTMTVWRSRSGRLHAMRRCSGAGPSTVRVLIEREALLALRAEQTVDHQPLCRCLVSALGRTA